MRLPDLRQWLAAPPILLTALGTWRIFTAFPILPAGHLETFAPKFWSECDGAIIAGFYKR